MRIGAFAAGAVVTVAIVATAALAAFAAPARADETGERTFVVELAHGDPELREDCSRRLFAWWDEMTAEKAAPKGWDETRLGPWSLVVRTSGGGFVEERPGLVRVLVNVVADGLRSRSETADAYAAALLEGLGERVGRLDAGRVSAEYEPLQRERAEAETASRAADEELRRAEASGPAPERRAASVAVRIGESERNAAAARIDRAVSARKLETARAACDRALEIERLRREAGAAEKQLDLASAAEAEPARAKLAALRDAIDALARTTPALDTARETVFRLEVDLVGLEAREKALAEELAALRTEETALHEAVRRHGPAVRAAEAARARLDAAQRRLDDFTRRRSARGPLMVVVRAPGPPSAEFPSPKKEERR